MGVMGLQMFILSKITFNGCGSVHIGTDYEYAHDTIV